MFFWHFSQQKWPGQWLSELLPWSAGELKARDVIDEVLPKWRSIEVGPRTEEALRRRFRALSRAAGGGKNKKLEVVATRFDGFLKVFKKLALTILDLMFRIPRETHTKSHTVISSTFQSRPAISNNCVMKTVQRTFIDLPVTGIAGPGEEAALAAMRKNIAVMYFGEAAPCNII